MSCEKNNIPGPNISWEDIRKAYERVYGKPMAKEFKGPMPASKNLAHILGNAVADRSELEIAVNTYKDVITKYNENLIESQPVSEPEEFSGKPLFLSFARDEEKYRSSAYSSKFYRNDPAHVVRSNSRSKRNVNSQ